MNSNFYILVQIVILVYREMYNSECLQSVKLCHGLLLYFCGVGDIFRIEHGKYGEILDHVWLHF